VNKGGVTDRNFDYRIHESPHSIRNFLLKPCLRPIIQQRIKSVIEHQLQSSLESLDLALFALYQRVLAAGVAAPNPVDFIKAVLLPSPKKNTATKTSKGIIKRGRRQS
jgi:hypothetical protein